jgi:DNA-binding GntR family transcriptional regulator
MNPPLNLLILANPMNTAEKVYCGIKNMLFNYEIVPGQKLQYQDLAEKFRVSRTPVKDALNMLQREGYVELKHNRGYFVCELRANEAEGLYDIRETLETLIAAKAIENWDPESLKAVKEAMAAFSADLKMPPSRKRLILDTNFHVRIAEMTRNKVLVEMIHQVFSRNILKYKVEYLSPQRGRVADSDHRQIYQAIRRRDVAGAREKMKRHTELSRKSVLGFLGAEGE